MNQEELIRLPVVGIGASAGGIRALQELFKALPSKVGAAFVVIVHLSPSHTSELSHILSAHTGMRVVQVSGRLPLEADTVYIIPPDRQLSISDSHIADSAFEEPRGQRAPIDTFFRSLAEQHGDGYAVVLSGGGSDGALGVRSIREGGGLILVQNPEEAEFGSMPRNAIAAGADFVLPIKDLAAQLVALVEARRRLIVGENDDEIVSRILAQMKLRTGQDFSQYKRSTVLRRITRRMQVCRTGTLADYLTWLRQHADEAQALFNDLLISVTSFFRDPEAFKALSRIVVPALFDTAGKGGVIRVWVPACATGEEAYSIAMLLLDEAARREFGLDIQVFASDLDVNALALAREGRYPAAIGADVGEEHLNRYFTREDEHYRIRREVRDRIVFAMHSLIKDPPFSRVQMVSCRNFLIYLDREVQQRACSILHYALAPGGFLMLGASESADAPPGLFTLVDREARIYRANDRPMERQPLPLIPATTRLPPAGPLPHPERPLPPSAAHLGALEAMAPPSLLVGSDYRVLNVSVSAGRYLQHPGGPVISDAVEIVRPELRAELLSALHAAFERNQRSLSLPIAVQFDGVRQAVVLQAAPVPHGRGAGAALVLFLEGGPIPEEAGEAVAEAPGPAFDQLRNELAITRGQLRTMREQYETAIEELRAANEELQSINEEYRSTGEELETSKEELQSINEELQTVNQELKAKLEEVSRAHSDLQNLITATDVGTLFLDQDLRIKLFTPRVADIFNITEGDGGRAITDFTHQLDYRDIVADSRRVIADLVPIEQTVGANGERWFLVRLRPYRTVENRIEGVVITFVDITERRQSDMAWEARQSMLLGELSHRVKNTLAVVMSIVRFSLRDDDVSPDVMIVVEDRLQALSRSHDLLVRQDWKGANLETLAREQLGPFMTDGSDRLEIKGLPTILPPNRATPVGLVLHELATNAAKHGAWKVPGGKVTLEWRSRDGDGGSAWIDLTWREQGGPPPHMEHKGTGSKLIEGCLGGGRVHYDVRPEGIVCEIAIPVRPARSGGP